jgi:hypothetical protein
MLQGANCRIFNELSFSHSLSKHWHGICILNLQITRLASRGGRNATSTVFRFWGVS